MVGHVTGGDSTVLYVGFFSFLIKDMRKEKYIEGLFL
jgi:hypothetical protein